MSSSVIKDLYCAAAFEENRFLKFSWHHGYVPLGSRLPLTGFADLSAKASSLTWAWQKADERLGVLKDMSHKRAGMELLASELAGFCHILLPRVEAVSVSKSQNFALCFSPVIGEKPQTLHQLADAKNTDAVHEVSCYLSAFLPFNMLVGNWDLCSKNVVVSNQQYAGKAPYLVYVIDNEKLDLSTREADSFLCDSFLMRIFKKDSPYYVVPEIMHQSARVVAKLEDSVIDKCVGKMFELCAEEFDLKPKAVVEVLCERRDRIKQNWAESMVTAAQLQKAMKYRPNIYEKVV